jgi:thiosulfate/3-mercaptopyruvate sulfurtransferase
MNFSVFDRAQRAPFDRAQRAPASLALTKTGLAFMVCSVLAFSISGKALAAPANSAAPAVTPNAMATAPIISPAALKTLVDQKAVRVLDIREIFQTDGKTPNYAAGHIPGAVAAPYSSLRGPNANPGRMISEAEFSKLVSAWGITPDMHVVFAGTGGDATDFGGAARFYWTFKIAGFKKLSILDGGLGAWMALKYEQSTDTPKITPTQVQLRFDRAQIVNHTDIAKLLPGLSGKGTDKTAGVSAKPRLLDTRPEEYFTGEDKHPSAARAGTLPGARHFDQEEFFQMNTGKLLPKAELESLAKSAGLITTDDTITFCNTGHWSATAWFVLSEILGQTNTRMYPESAIGWSKSKLPMDNEPARTKLLWRDLKEGVSNLKN